MSATLASPLNTGSTVPALTPVTVPCRTPTCAWALAAPSNSAMTIDDFFRIFMLGLRDRVARRLAGNDALYWRRREFGYPSQSRVDSTRQFPAHPRTFAASPVDPFVIRANNATGVVCVMPTFGTMTDRPLQPFGVPVRPIA